MPVDPRNEAMRMHSQGEVISIADSPFGPAGCRQSFDDALAEFVRLPEVWEIFRDGGSIASKALHLRGTWDGQVESPHAG